MSFLGLGLADNLAPEPLIWSGPVSLKDAEAAALPGQRVAVLPCTGNAQPPPLCAELAAGGLEAVQKRAGFEDAAVVSLAGFSAGGQMMKRVLEAPTARRRVRMVYGADAFYTTTGAPEGFVAYAVEAASDPSKLFVASSSAFPNKNYPNGVETMKMIMAEVERRTGRRFGPTTLAWPIEPEDAWSLGNVHFAAFGKRITHGEHATMLAPMMFREGVIAARDEAEVPPVTLDTRPPEPSVVELFVAGAVSGAATYALFRYVMR